MTVTQNRATPVFDHVTSRLDDHLALLGPLPEPDPVTLRAAVTASGLAGRGGAGFPTGRKLAAVAQGGRGVVVANGAEGEPASAKDRFLLMSAPHLVLDGLQLAALACGARQAIVYAPYNVLRHSVEPAIRERRDRIAVRTVESPDAFLSGEESAVVAAVNGGRAIPYSTPPRVFERGVEGRPTLVQNVETLAHVALVARYGPEWFRAGGSPEEPGSRLVTLSGSFRSPGVYEVPGGARLEDVLASGGGVADGVSALLIGGYHGGWVPYDAVPHLWLSRDSLAPYDAAPGAGVVIALGASTCGLRAGADIAGYLAGQGARQCGPCRNGLPTLAATLQALAYGPTSPGLARDVERVSGLVANRGACHHPAGTVRLVRSTMRTFSAEVAAHLKGRCTAR
jgi:NADH:ubiquinone oxidoreductase subunit F (NADH-binding)